jgi:hypothetical protein
LRFNFVVAKGRGGSPSRPPSDLRALHVGASGARPIMGVRPDAPTTEAIVPLTFKGSGISAQKMGFLRDHQI